MSLPSMYGHCLCAVDLETTGTLAGYHEICQIACVPLNQHFEPDPRRKFFYMNVAPEYPDRISKEATRKTGLTEDKLKDALPQDRAIDLFIEWFENLDLPFGKRLVPLAHNWAFERAFLIHWLGMDGYNSIWQSTARDTMTFASSINDLYCWHGRQQPFQYVGLGYMSNRFDIKLDNAHDALADCLATAKLYAELMRFLGG
jgi:DNA polymerase III epsilon subunit-like protein